MAYMAWNFQGPEVYPRPTGAQARDSNCCHCPPCLPPRHGCMNAFLSCSSMYWPGLAGLEGPLEIALSRPYQAPQHLQISAKWSGHAQILHL